MIEDLKSWSLQKKPQRYCKEEGNKQSFISIADGIKSNGLKWHQWTLRQETEKKNNYICKNK